MNLKPLQDFSGEERSILGLFGIDVGNQDIPYLQVVTKKIWF